MGRVSFLFVHCQDGKLNELGVNSGYMGWAMVSHW